MPDWQATISEQQALAWETIGRLAPEADGPRCFVDTFLAAHEAAGRDAVADWRLLIQRCATAQALAALHQRAEAMAPTQLGDALRQQLGRLPEQAALSFCLRYLCSFSFQEISMELRAPLDGIGSSVNDVCSEIGAQLLERHPQSTDDTESPAQAADDLLEDAVTQVRRQTIAPMPEGLAQQAIEAVAAAPEIVFEKPPEPDYGLRTMVIALLLAIIGGAIWGYIATRPKPPAIAFEQVVKALSTVQSATYRMTKNLDLPDKRTRKIDATIEVAGPGRMREVMDPPNTVIIWDSPQKKALTLDEIKKRATLRDSADMFEETRPIDALTLLGSLAAADGKPTSQTAMKGRLAQGFKVVRPDGQLIIWADVGTKLPVIVEMVLAKANPPGTALLSDFTWNAAVDEALVSLDAPEGYELSAIKVNLKPATESDLVKALGVAVRLNGGKFPDQFDRAGMGQLITKLYGKLPENKQSPEYRAAAESLEADLLQLGRGWMYISEPENGGEWHYSGGGVYFGSDKPVLWYRPAGSRNYQLVDGALDVRPVQPNRLPDVPSQTLRQAATRPAILPQ